MKKWTMWMAMIALAAFVTVGCGGGKKDGVQGEGSGDTAETDGADDADDGKDAAAEVTLTSYCGNCGELAGSKKCCKPGVAGCDLCGFFEGSALCCKKGLMAEDFADMKLCKLCGHAYDTSVQHTCDTEHEQCADCKRHKGSELCCFEKKVEAQPEEDPETTPGNRPEANPSPDSGEDNDE